MEKKVSARPDERATTDRLTDRHSVEKLALFFYFCFMDEGRAQAATRDSLFQLRKRRSDGRASSEAVIVNVTDSILRKNPVAQGLRHVGFIEGYVDFPEGSNWGPWFEYRKSADAEDFSTLIWVKVLGFTISDVASGLGVSEGTVKFRLGNAMRDLGQLVPA
jgi:hypothetical protein